MWALDFYGDKGTAKGCFLFPKGITADEKGNVFVADSGNNRVVHLFNPKSKLEWIEAFTGKTETDGGLKGPSRLALDADEMVYVTDPGNERIVVFSNTGIVKRTIPAQNEIKFENGLTALVVADGRFDKSYYKSDKVLFCADMTGTRLWKIGLYGQVISQVLLPAGYQASYSAVDYYHNVWLTDPQKHCLLKYDHNLKLLDIFGSYGTGDNQFVEPRGIAIHKRFGQVFVAEKKGAQYYWIGTQFKSAVIKKNESGRYLLTIKATEYSFVSLFSYKDTDTLFFLKRQMITPGSSVVSISDIESKIDQSSLFLKIEPTYSSYTYNAWYFPVKVEK
jgi:outer membrane protein assembly factor BamB